MKAKQGQSEMEIIELLPSPSPAPTPMPPARALTNTQKLSHRDQELRSAIDAQDVTAVKLLLDQGVSVSCEDEDGMTPLHHSLLRYSEAGRHSVRAPPNHEIYDKEREIMTNFLKKPESRRSLLQYLDSMVPSENKNQAKEIVKEILAAVLQRNEIDVLEHRNGDGCTPLYTAIQSEDLEIIKALVDAGANVEVVSDSGETALHVAARYKDEILKYFLDNHITLNTVDNKGYAPIHYAVTNNALESVILLLDRFHFEHIHLKIDKGRTFLHEIAARTDFATNQRFLHIIDLNYMLFCFVNEVDDNGETPVFTAASQNHEAMTALLLRRGGILSVHRGKQAVIEAISANFANPTEFFEDLFDNDVYIQDNYYAYIRYKVLTDGEDVSQVRVIEKLVSQGHSALLQHPVIESLICLKWKCLLPVFYVFVATYVVFLGTFNTFVITLFNEIDTSDVNYQSSNTTNLTTGLPSEESCGWHHWLLVALIYISIIILFAQECFWIYLRKLSYFVHRESWVRLCGLGLAAAVPIVMGCSPAPDSESWQRPVVCAALLLVWLQAMLLMSRFPGWGFYAFGKVATNLLKILVTSTCFVVGFSTCFMILYKSKPPFDGPIPAFIKTVVMMSSEFDYEDLFDDNHEEELRYTKPIVRLLFIMFVVFVAIVLMNFMIGVAVSDINELNDVGNIKRLEKQVELLNNLEGLEDTVLRNWWPRLNHVKFQRMMCVSANNPDKPHYVQHKEDKTCHNNCCRPTFSSKLRNNIFRTAKKEKQNLNTLDSLYEAVVGEKYNPKRHNTNASLISDTATLDVMNNRIKSIENAYTAMKQDLKQFNDRLEAIDDASKEVKRSIENLMKINKTVESIEHSNNEIKQSVDEVKKVRTIIEAIEKTNREIKEFIVDSKIISKGSDKRCQ